MNEEKITVKGRNDYKDETLLTCAEISLTCAGTLLTCVESYLCLPVLICVESYLPVPTCTCKNEGRNEEGEKERGIEVRKEGFWFLCQNLTYLYLPVPVENEGRNE